MKKILLICLVFFMVLPCMASHIVGGEMSYQYVGPGLNPNTSSYIITLKLFRDENCTNCAQMPADVWIGIYNNDNNSEILNPANGLNYFDVPKKGNDSDVLVNPFPPCISNPPLLHYHVATFTLSVTLPNNVKGYTASYQTCCRVHPLENVFNNASSGGGTGSTYSCSIPPVPDSSPEFSTSVDAICRQKHFTLKYNASDEDGDSLVYSFAPAYNSGDLIDSHPVNPAPPSYSSV